MVPPCLMVIVELRGLEPLTFSMPLRRAPNCATAPRYPSALKRGNGRYSATTTSTFHRCGSQASSAFPRSPSAPCRDPTFTRLSVGMAYYSRSQPLRFFAYLLIEYALKSSFLKIVFLQWGRSSRFSLALQYPYNLAFNLSVRINEDLQLAGLELL